MFAAFDSGSRLKRSASHDVEDFDVDSITQLYHLLDTTVGTNTEVSTSTPSAI